MMSALIAVSLFVQSQDPQTEERLRKVEADLEAIKKEHSAAQPAFPALHFSGYGDAHLNAPRLDTFSPRADSAADLHHLVIGAGVDFNDWISAEFEVDFEHAADEVEAEFAVLDLRLNRWVTFRSGLLLMPVGSLNETHEPPHYLSVERPYFHRYLIHTTWQELGAGFVGELPAGDCSLRYRIYYVAGLVPTGLGSLDVLDGAFGHAKNSIATGGAVTGRLEFQPASWIFLGASAYAGRAETRDVLHTNVSIATLDATLQGSGLTFHVEAGQIWIDRARNVSANVADAPVAARSRAAYAEIGYDVLHVLAPASDHRLVLFVRTEWIHTQAEPAPGFARAPGGRRLAVIAGAAFFLTEDVVLKVDNEFWENDADQRLHRFNIGVGFQFHIR